MDLSPLTSRSTESLEGQKGVSRLLCLSGCYCDHLLQVWFFRLFFFYQIAFSNFLRNLGNLSFPCNKVLKAMIWDIFSSYQLLFVVSIFSCTSEFSKQQELSLLLELRKFSSQHRLQKTEKRNDKTFVHLGPYICEFLRISSEFTGIP